MTESAKATGRAKAATAAAAILLAACALLVLATASTPGMRQTPEQARTASALDPDPLGR